MSLPPVHLAIMQPAGYVHSLAFVDHARYFRYQFRRFGVQVTIGKNRLREDAINFVFGAHTGFRADAAKRHVCVFVNLEQLGAGGAAVDPAYLALLRSSAVVDYDAANTASYAQDAADVPLVPFLHAPYLADVQAIPLAKRPIDLLFFGSMNPRRKEFIARVEACGVNVAAFDHPLYADERDHYIRQAKAVINCHFYETSRFEQARVFQCLSLGTPVISERTPRTHAHPAYDDAVFWLDSPQAIAPFFGKRFGTEAFFAEAQQRLAAFRQHDPQEAYADLLAFASGYAQVWHSAHPAVAWQPTEMNLGSGKDYKAGWLNVDILERAEPDVVLDLGRPIELPLQLQGCRGGEVLLQAGCLERVYANNVLEHVPDLPCLMTNVLALLKDGGEFEIEVPYEKAPTAWQDPTHLRAMNEQSWQYYTGWFWYLGWFEHRFDMTSAGWLDLQLQPCPHEKAAFMKVTLRKVATTLQERTIARAMQADMGGIPDDLAVFEPANGRDESDAMPADVPEPASSITTATVSAPVPIVLPAPTPRAAEHTWLILTPPHHDQVTTNFARAMAAALEEGDERARVIDSSQGLPEQLRGIDLAALAGVICIGTLPLALRLDGRLLHQRLTCPVYAYFLDSPIYDIARVPAARQFLQDAWQEERLVPLLAENSYLQLLRAGSQPVLPPQSRYLPFAAFAATPTKRNTPPPQRRLLVVGSLGQELSSGAVRQDLLQTLRDANHSGIAEADLLRVGERLMQPQARGNCAADFADALGASARSLIEQPLLNLCCAADSYMKRSRRLAGIEALRGQPVDFIGPGWKEVFGAQAGFRFLGSVDHGDLGALMGLYRGVMNFDPNWEWGMHDRAYTALSQGVPVLTHANQAIAEEGLAGPLVHPFVPNAPVLRDIAAGLLVGAKARRHTPFAPDRIGWGARMRTLLGGHATPGMAVERPLEALAS
ncbi:hypothetical protein BH11PSE9_BH11PSE9_17490 [soil metagenome]